MKVEKSISRRYEFSGFEHNVFDGDNEKRLAIVTHAVITCTVYPDVPDSMYVNETLRGWECKSDGTKDKRGNGRSYIPMFDSVKRLELLLILADASQDAELIDHITRDLSDSVAQAKADQASLEND